MFDSLSSRLEGIVKRLRGKGRLTEDDVDEMLKEIRTALLNQRLIQFEVRKTGGTPQRLYRLA